MMFLFILYTSFLFCTEFYIALAENTDEYLTGIRGEDVSITGNLALADTFIITEHPDDNLWYYVNVVGKHVVFDIALDDEVLIYYEKDFELAEHQQFYFVLLPNFEFAIENADAKCIEFIPDTEMFKRLPCNYSNDINQRFKLTEKKSMGGLSHGLIASHYGRSIGGRFGSMLGNAFGASHLAGFNLQAKRALGNRLRANNMHSLSHGGGCLTCARNRPNHH